MKYLRRIFEFVQSYPFEYIGLKDTTYYYYFSDEKNEFSVEFDKKSQTEVELIYRVKENDDWTFNVVSTNIFSIMKTVFSEILKDFINKNDWCQMITIKGLGKSFEKEPVNQRTKVYFRYLKNNPIDGWELNRYGNEIYLDKII